MGDELYTVTYNKQFKSGTLIGLTVPCKLINWPWIPIRLCGKDAITGDRYVLSQFVWVKQ